MNKYGYYVFNILLLINPQASVAKFRGNGGVSVPSPTPSMSRARLETNYIDSGGDTPDDIPLNRLDIELNDGNRSFGNDLLHIQGLYDDLNSITTGRFLGPSSVSATICNRKEEFLRRQQGAQMMMFHSNDESQLRVPIKSEPLFNSIGAVQKQNNHHQFRTLKTGTTIVGVKTPSCIIIAADTRATESTVVADKRCEKVHQLAQNVWCCGAGTSGDLDALTRRVRYTFLLKGMLEDSIGNGSSRDTSVERKNTEDDSDIGNYVVEGVEEDSGHRLGRASISAICNMIRESLYKNGGQIGANLVLGGFDPYTQQPILTAIHPHGSIDVVPYTALGSGGLAAMGILESRYEVDLSLDEGIELAKDAVRAGIENDLGSGSQIDLCIISAKGVRYSRGVVLEEKLVMSKEDEDINNTLFLRLTDEKQILSMDGVNGFGSLPYMIKSRTKLMDDEVVFEKRNRDWLKRIVK